MKILLVNHESAAEWVGGDSVQISETVRGLRLRGHHVDCINSNKPDVFGYDLVHIFNCRSNEAFSSQVDQCHNLSIPIVVSPIWINLHRAIWGSRLSKSVLKLGVEHGAEYISSFLEQLKHRSLVLELDSGERIYANTQSDKYAKKLASIGANLRQVDGILPNSWLELKALQSDFNWVSDEFAVAHYGVNSKVFLDPDPTLFRQYLGSNDQFVLQAGRIEPAKNQAMLCWALRETNLPIVLIGSSKHDPEYVDLCKKISGNKLRVIDHLPQTLLASAYAAARVHALPSWAETCGLVTLEAALAGTPVVGSTFGHELEYLQEDCRYADPADPVSIREAVQAAWEDGSSGQRAMRLQRRVLERFNWQRTVESTEVFYKRVIE